MGKQYFVVLVDDEEKVHHTIKLYLERNDALGTLKSFYTPVELLEYLKTTADVIDLILLDIHFKNSGLSGLEAIPFIREEYLYVPIILLTGMDSEAIREAERFSNTLYSQAGEQRPTDQDDQIICGTERARHESAAQTRNQDPGTP